MGRSTDGRGAAHTGMEKGADHAPTRGSVHTKGVARVQDSRADGQVPNASLPPRLPFMEPVCIDFPAPRKAVKKNTLVVDWILPPFQN